jgi:hypothetical protein
MIRKFLLIAPLFLLAGLLIARPAHAQDKVEIYGGYSFLHLDSSPSTNMNGWILSGQYKFNPWLGAVAEANGEYGGGASLHTVMVGPQVSWPARISPFAHVLIGGAHFEAGPYGDTSFSTALGGGIDAKVSPLVSWRIIEGDYVFTHFGGVTENNARISTGIVFRF